MKYSSFEVSGADLGWDGRDNTVCFAGSNGNIIVDRLTGEIVGRGRGWDDITEAWTEGSAYKELVRFLVPNFGFPPALFGVLDIADFSAVTVDGKVW